MVRSSIWSFTPPNRGALLWWLAPSKEGQALERLAQGFHPGLEALEAWKDWRSEKVLEKTACSTFRPTHLTTQRHTDPALSLLLLTLVATYAE